MACGTFRRLLLALLILHLADASGGAPRPSTEPRENVTYAVLTEQRESDSGSGDAARSGPSVDVIYVSGDNNTDVKSVTTMADPDRNTSGRGENRGVDVDIRFSTSSTLHKDIPITTDISVEVTRRKVTIARFNATEALIDPTPAPSLAEAEAMTSSPVEIRVLFSGSGGFHLGCPDPHQNRSASGKCECVKPDYKRTDDPDAGQRHLCRNATGGWLGDPCTDVSSCNYQIRHVECGRGDQGYFICLCSFPYSPHGDTHCYSNPTGWLIAIKTAGITVMVLAFGFFLAFALKACTKSRLRRRIPWLRRSSDVSFRSEDFYAAAAGFAIADRPPSYSEEDVNKPPNYEELFPGPQSEGGIDNAAFSPDARDQPVQRQAATAELATSARPPAAVRQHRRGLSGPAALSLGSDADGDSPRAAASSAAAAGAVPRLPPTHIESNGSWSGGTGAVSRSISHPSVDTAAETTSPAAAEAEPPPYTGVTNAPAEVWHDIEL